MSRIHYTTLFSEEALQDALDKKLVNKRKHPEHDIWIYNYGALAQFNWVWTPVTLNCRGLVLDADGYIVARALPKFFSYEQLDGKLPEGKFVVEEKMDGSMLLVFYYNGELVTATRGSFESDQATKGAEFFGQKDYKVTEGTLVFEIVYSDNRIVVNYDYEGLVLLSEVWNCGSECPSEVLDQLAKDEGWKRPKVYSFNSLEEILSHKEDNLEGFVLHYESGERVKIKLEEYKRLHRLITGVSEKTVWEALRDNKLDELLENVPDEFYDWVTEVKEKLESQYQFIENWAKNYFTDLHNRRDNALYYQKFPYPSILFNMLDKKDYSGIIWKIVRPEVTKVFKMISEDNN